MLRKIGYSLLCAGLLFSINSLAMTQTHSIMPGATHLEYALPPNDPQVIANSWFWPITATCKIKSKDPSNDISTKMLSKSGKINGDPIAQGENRVVSVHPGDTLIMTLESGAKVKLTNRGKHVIVSECSI